MGGLGLCSAPRTALAASWASWADTLPMLQARNPRLAASVLLHLSASSAPQTSPFSEVSASAATLRHEGFVNLPTWNEILAGVRPDIPNQVMEPREPGEWLHGWQFYAAAARDTHFRSNSLFPRISGAHRALLRSQSGPCSGRVFTCSPTSSEFSFTASHYRTLLLRRLRLPISFINRQCSYSRNLDALGDHRAACPISGFLRRRAIPLEVAAARVCREAGARVSQNVFLRDMNVPGIDPADGRQIEVVANGLPTYGGVQLAIDTTLVSPLTRDGLPHPNTEHTNGARLETALQRKIDKYPEFEEATRCRLVTIAIEVGGRWDSSAVHFIRQLAVAKARSQPPALRFSTELAFFYRWTSLLSVAALRSLACSLNENDAGTALNVDGDEPQLEDVLHASRLDEPASFSRLF